MRNPPSIDNQILYLGVRTHGNVVFCISFPPKGGKSVQIFGNITRILQRSYTESDSDFINFGNRGFNNFTEPLVVFTTG